MLSLLYKHITMLKFIRYSFIFLLFFIVSCDIDDINEIQNGNQDINEETTGSSLDFGATVQADFIGRVVNDDGIRVNNATVTIGSQIVQTDTNGVFSMQNVNVFENFAFVKVTKDTYIKGSRAIVPQTDAINTIEITLLRKNIVETINSGESSQITHENSTIFFQGEFEYPDGTPYNGQIDVSVHYLEPNQSETFTSMPGMLLGEDNNGSAQAMETYGMLAINLFDQAGEELDIVADFPATLEFPVDPDQLTIAPDEIPLWYFDEEMGYWKEEGSAIRQGNKYVGEVTHFTWWNCDLPLEYVTLCLHLTSNEQTLSGNYIEIVRNETGQTIFYGTLDQNGSECGLIPANEQITLNIYGNDITCQDQVIYQEIIGPFTADSSIDLVIPPDNIESTLITGNVLNCDNTQLQEGYAIIVQENNSFIAGPIPIINGELSYQFNYCIELEYQIRVFDSNTNQVSGFVPFNVDSNEIMLGTISLCEEQSLIYEGDVFFGSQEDVNAFGGMGYIEINGDLFMHDSAIQNLNSLEPLFSLEKITGDLSLFAVSGLTNLNGLENLIEVEGAIHLAGLDNLENIEALTNVTNTTFVSLYFLSSLQSLQGIENIENISSLVLSALVNIQSIDLLDTMNLSSLENLTLSVLPNIDSLTALNQISSLTSLEIIKMESLQNLNGLENLSSALSLQIGGENSVNLGNPILTDFCALLDLFTLGNYDSVEIANNAYNPSVQEIVNGNCSN